MASQTVLLLPGLSNSGPDHWQSRWEAENARFIRVLQADWERPRRADWVATLTEAVRAQPQPVLLAAHSLGCALVAWWASQHPALTDRVTAALLVAPPDVERPDVAALLPDFAPMPRDVLPFPACVMASSNDPWCALERARAFAQAWNARFEVQGALGHLNADSDLGAWPEGRARLARLALEGRS